MVCEQKTLAAGFDGAALTAVSDKFVGLEGGATFCIITDAARLVVAVFVGASGWCTLQL